MYRRQKIIVSVTGIFLVLLLLVGLTYAYFLTRITGNTNDKSISVSTANLAIVYGNDDGSVIGEGEKITPGTTFEPKTFTVTNQGNANTDYVVVIEEANVTYAETIEVDGVTQTAGTETTFESNDFTYTLTCESGCNGVSIPLTFPIEGGILIGNRLDVGETQRYSFTLTYKETGENQSNDMNKKLEAKINIIDITKDNPYKDNTNSLAYNIINNAILGTIGTTLVGTPETIPAVSISGYTGTGEYELATDFPGWEGLTYGNTQEEADSGENEITTGTDLEICNNMIEKYISDAYEMKYNVSQIGKVIDCNEDGIPYIEINEYEQVLSVTQDDLGISYYYRGAVEDNYLEFNNMCWRIVRIEGDGSVKITLAAQKKCNEITEEDTGTAFIGTGHYGYNKTKITNSSGGQTNYDAKIADYINSPTDNMTSMKYKLEEWFNGALEDEKTPRFSEEIKEFLKKDSWCLGNATNAYDSETGVLLTSNVNDLMYETTKFYYDGLRRLSGVGIGKYATLRCDGNNYKKHISYIGTLTADEVVFAGGKYNAANKNFYLTANATSNKWRTISLSFFQGSNDASFHVEFDGYVTEFNNFVDNNEFSLRPTISLKAGTVITGGNGIKSNPYAVQ